MHTLKGWSLAAGFQEACIAPFSLRQSITTAGSQCDGIELVPAEAVEGQYEASFRRQVDHLADRRQGILRTGSDHREIIGVPGTQLETLIRHYFNRSISAPQAPSFSTSRS